MFPTWVTSWHIRACSVAIVLVAEHRLSHCGGAGGLVVTEVVTAVLVASGGDCMETRALGSTRTIAIIVMISDSTVGPRYYELLQLNKCNFNTYSILGSMTYTGSGTYMYMNNL